MNTWPARLVQLLRLLAIQDADRADAQIQEVIHSPSAFLFRVRRKPNGLNPSRPWEVEFIVETSEMSTRGVRVFGSWSHAMSWVEEKIHEYCPGPGNS